MFIVIAFFTAFEVTLLANKFQGIFGIFFGNHCHSILGLQKMPKSFTQNIIKN
jgi:hypothetical protein